MTLTLGIVTDTSHMNRAITGAIDAFEHPTANELGDGAQEAQEVYLAAMQARYIEQAMGAGEWAELAEETQKERAEQGFDPTRPILIRTHALFNALFPTRPGNIFEVLPDRVRAGIGGNEIHPGYEPYGGSPGTLTFGEIASLHQSGTSRMPARPILVEPETQTIDAMHAAVTKAVSAMWSRVIR